MKRISFFIPLMLYFFLPGIGFSQEILTAEKYFDKISGIYGDIDDYQANITITQEGSVMEGVVYYKKPNLLRIDFSEPKDQVLVIDGEALTIYIPEHSVIMHQPLKKKSKTAVATMASQQGLLLLRRNYSFAYLIGPDPVPLNQAEPGEEVFIQKVKNNTDGTDREDEAMVIKLKLDWRSTDEGFRQIEISVGENGLIRRIIGVTIGYENIQLDFTKILVNQNIPDARFKYDSPPSANVFENFLFAPEE